MTIRTVLAVAAVTATAAVAVPAGWAQTGEARGTPGAIEQAVLAREQAQRGSLAQLRPTAAPGAADAHERAVGIERAAGVATATDSHDRVALPGTRIALPTLAGGRDLEWPQVGAGFLLALVLVAAFWLPLRTTRSRPATH